MSILLWLIIIFGSLTVMLTVCGTSRRTIDIGMVCGAIAVILVGCFILAGLHL